jgi:hypothetical protein
MDYICIEVINNENEAERLYIYRSLVNSSKSEGATPPSGIIPTDVIYVKDAEFKDIRPFSAAVKDIGHVRNMIQSFHSHEKRRVDNVLDDGPSALRNLIQKKGSLIQYVPDEYLTQDLCILAMRNNANIIQYIPDFIKLDPSFIDRFVDNPPVVHPNLNVGSTKRFIDSIDARQKAHRSRVFRPKFRSHTESRTPASRLLDQQRSSRHIYSFLGGRSKKSKKRRSG